MSNLIERELNDLRSYRVRLRREIESLGMRAALEPQKQYGPDGYGNRIAQAQAQFRGTERRWEELHLLLGRRAPGPAIRLDTPARSAPVRSARTRSAPGYLTRALFSGS